jgi:cellobiose-specific phosphotransferase system component IIA
MKLLQEGAPVTRPTLTPFISAVAFALAACATTDPPEREMGAARAMVSQARPVADRDAPQELAQAQQKLARAEAAMQRGHYEHARILAEQAEADAKVAWTVAENVRVQRSAAEVQDGTRALREEMERKGR